MLFKANCALSIPAASKDPSVDQSLQPKTIRICFAHLPLATTVTRAPAGSPLHPTAPGQQLVLSCRIPSWDEILSKGGVADQNELLNGIDGKVGVFCEILGGQVPGLALESVIERVWFGDVIYPGVGHGNESTMGMYEGHGDLAVGGWAGDEGENQSLSPSGCGRIRIRAHDVVLQISTLR